MKNVLIILMTILLSACATAPAMVNRPSDWAQPVSLEGVGNLHKITGNLYRGSQPTSGGYQNLANMGIVTIINLRHWHSDDVGNTTILDDHIRVATWCIEDEEVIKVLKILRTGQGPFFIHCQHGSDRTGVMSAMHRIVEQGWSKERAIDEMVHGGYGFHPIWQNIIEYIRNVDVEKITTALR